MNKYRLPASLRLGDADYKIRTDFRIILGILKYFQDESLTIEEKWGICLKTFYVDFESIKEEDYPQALKEAREFIDAGAVEEDNNRPSLVDWDHDAGMILPAVNRVAGCDIRGLENLHWWTFLGWYMEIGEGTFNTVVSIRNKKAKHKKLEKWEKEFIREHKNLINISNQGRSDEEKEALEALVGA